MRNCLCSCPALSDASDTLSDTYHVYAALGRTKRAGLMRGTRTEMPSWSSVSSSSSSSNPMDDLPLCFSVRAKIINGEGPDSLRYPRSVSPLTMTKFAPRAHLFAPYRMVHASRLFVPSFCPTVEGRPFEKAVSRYAIARVFGHPRDNGTRA